MHTHSGREFRLVGPKECSLPRIPCPSSDTLMPTRACAHALSGRFPPPSLTRLGFCVLRHCTSGWKLSGRPMARSSEKPTARLVTPARHCRSCVGRAQTQRWLCMAAGASAAPRQEQCARGGRSLQRSGSAPPPCPFFLPSSCLRTRSLFRVGGEPTWQR
jgi:hypothetical protein